MIDTLATTFIVGVKGHLGYESCQKCHIIGICVELDGCTKTGHLKKGIHYLNANATA